MCSSLRAEMARYQIKDKDVSELLGIDRKTFYLKVTGKSGFTNKEMGKIRDHFFPNMTIDFLFFEDAPDLNVKTLIKK